MKRILVMGLLASVSCTTNVSFAVAAEERTNRESPEPAKWAPAVKPKPLSDHVRRGLAWLVQTQLPNGGWGQGEESSHMRGSGLEPLKDVGNVADTCISLLALVRAGSTPSQGEHAGAIRRGLDFICAEIAASDSQSLYITSVRGTRVQGKLGTYIDTFLAALVLAEVKDQMPDEPSRKKIIAALDKVMDKIERNQRPDGTWDNAGWAPVLAQAMAGKAINRAVQAGISVDEKVRANTEKYARGQFDAAGGGRFAGEGSAGVALYAAAASVGAMQDSDNTNRAMEAGLRERIATATSQPQRAEAEAQLQRFRAVRDDLEVARAAVVDKLEDPRFVAGFGSNGGEEFLSYMNIGESLVVQGGAAWEKWDESMTANLNRIQNQDGSWTGHHCITGRNFCTASALLVLTVDRAPVPLAAKLRRGE